MKYAAGFRSGKAEPWPTAPRTDILKIR